MRLHPFALVALSALSIPVVAFPVDAQPSPAPAGKPQIAPPIATPVEQPRPTAAPSAPTQDTPNQIQFQAPPSGSPRIELDPGVTPPAPAPLEPPSSPPPPVSGQETRVLVAEVAVDGTTDAALQEEIFRAIRLRPGRTTTQGELQQDVNAVFATGFFSNVQVLPTDTPLGVKVTFVVQPNPILRAVVIPGKQVLPDKVVEDTFKPLYGSILNLRQMQSGIQEINKWYQDNGYVLAQVIDAPKVAEDGTVTLEVAEGVVEDIQVRFLTKEGEDKDAQGNPIQGRTRDFIITREFNLKPGAVFNRTQAERDLQRVFGLGIFEDVKLSLNPGQDPRKVVVVANVTERNTGSLGAGAGVSSSSGLFGTISYQEQNFGGNNQKLGAEFQLGEREALFDLNFTDPWIGGDPNRTSYTVNLFNRRSISLIFDGGPTPVRLANGDIPRIDRLGGGISFTRPLGESWTGSIGFQYQLVSSRDFNRNIEGRDSQGNPLTFSRIGVDDIYSLQFGVVQDNRNDPLRPTSGSLFRLGSEQTIPFGQGSILFHRVRGNYSYFIPTQWLQFAEGPQTLAFNIQAGTIFGDLPPYEAFALGGLNSVRGYDEGAVGSGRSFVQATAEYRFPLFSVVGGALFVDVATDLGTGRNVLGNPAGVRGKPGSGFGYGLGVRIQTPLGPLRLDYGIGDQGGSRIHFGLGERF